tara:strand:- start:63 stop:602 length:540 start_codon:yes stop_codon:yes gene_type:complete
MAIKKKARVNKKRNTAKKVQSKRKVVKRISKPRKKSKILDIDNLVSPSPPYKLKKNERYMNAKQKTHFINILNFWKKQLLIEQDRTADKLQENDSHFPDEADRATHEEEFTIELKTRERERKLLSKIEESLEYIQNNDYGYCTACGIEIGIRRLEARPTATRCIDCKTLEEIHERQQYG